MKIEHFSGKDSGVINLVTGKIRSQVSKDYLQMDKGKSKLFIKTPNAVMGIRGTDFMISTNGKNTSAILFEGNVVFNHLSDSNITDTTRLEDIVDRGVQIHPREFSVMEAERTIPTVPAVLNVEQFERLERNDGTEVERAPSNTTSAAPSKSVVPDGLNGNVVSNTPAVAKPEVAQASDPNGFVSGEKIKPTNGSFLHVDTGVIIAPGADSVLDANSNTYIAGKTSGSVDSNGNYIPPKNMEITSGGEMRVTVIDATGKPAVVTVTPPPPVKGDAPVGAGTLVGPSPAGGPVAPMPAKNDIIGAFTPGGPLGFPGAIGNHPGGNTSNDIKNMYQFEGKAGSMTNATIIIKP